MKQFLKFTLATITGIFIAGLIGSLLLFGFIATIASSSESTVKVQPNSVYELGLDGQLVERSQENPFEDIFSDALGQQSVASIGLDDVLDNIRKAKDDKNIKGIYLKGGMLTGGYASIKEIRDALADFKTTGKFIVAYADTYTQKAYYLASVADKVYINSKGMIEFQGIASNTMFIKNTLDKLGVEMQIVKVGSYKSAVEPYINTEMSPANKEQVTVYANSIWKNLLTDISKSRKISVADLNRYADEMMTFQPTEKYEQYKLVDSLTYADGMEQVFKKLTKESDFKNINFINHKQMVKVPATEKLQKDKVAVLYAVGGIDTDATDGIKTDDLVKEINKLKDEKSVKAVVFRVNSPGGSAYGSEQIWHAIGELKKAKPVVVSMGDYAASGGYYISCDADSIIAQPGTLTGSIGIFGTIPNIDGLNKKLGLSYDGVKTNKMSDAISLNRAFTPEERNLMQTYVNTGYELFVKHCADGRGIAVDSLKTIAEGRVWTGEDAVKIGLVDALGGLNDAVRIAAGKAKLDKYMVKSYPAKDDFMTKLLKNMNTEVETRFMKSKLGNENYRILRIIEDAKNMNGIHALMPFNITLN